MERREFLRKGLALGVAGLLPGVGLTANDCLSLVSGKPSEPIWDAAVNGRWDVVKQCLRRDPSLIGVTGEATIQDFLFKGLTLFRLAAASNSNVLFLKYLVSLSTDTNAVEINWNHSTVLAATFNSNAEVLRYLVSRGGDTNITGSSSTEGSSGGTLLHCAAKYNSNIEVLRYLVLQGADANAKTEDGTTPLHHAAKYNPNVEILKYIISAGARVYANDDEGKTPLDVADMEEKKCILAKAMYSLTKAMSEQEKAMFDSMCHSIRQGQIDFIVTATTHCAVAIKFDTQTMDAPIVVAKGTGGDVFEIYKLAMEYKIPVLEREPLALALFDTVEVGKQDFALKPEQMKMLFEVVKYVYKKAGRDLLTEYDVRLQNR